MFLKPKQSPSPWPFKLPRQIVRHFAGLMEKVLRDNDWKGGWTNDWKGGWTLDKKGMNVGFFQDKLYEEYIELLFLLQEIRSGRPVDSTQVAREAADVANVAMMIADNWGRTAEHASMKGCKLPPPGWVCTREPGHEGPCAAWPEGAQLPAEYKGCE